MWVNKWVGLPYQERGRGPDAYDCLGLVIAVWRERFGAEPPDPMISRTGSLRERVVRDAVGQVGDLRRVESAREGDLLLFYMAGGSYHVGYALDDKDMLHLESERLTSCIERWRSPFWLGKLEGVYRYEPA